MVKNLFPGRPGFPFDKPKKPLFSRLIELFRPTIAGLIDKGLVLLEAFDDVGDCVAVAVETGGEILNFVTVQP